MLVTGVRRPYHRVMLIAEHAYTRTLTLVLPESEWRQLRDAEPDAVGWLQQQIRDRLSTPQPAPATKESFETTDDEY